MTSNETEEDGYIYMALNGFGVSAVYLFMNCLTLLVGAVIIVLNAVVIDSLIRFKKPSEPADVMVCSLAIADMSTGFFLFYHTSYNLANFQIYIECLIRMGILLGLVVTSSLHLAGLTIDRYIKIMAPYRYDQLCKLSTVAAASAILWVISTLVAFTPAMGWNQDLYEDNATLFYSAMSKEDLPVCSFFGLMNANYLKFIISLFFVPLFIMGFLYLHIFKVANRHARVIAAQDGNQSAARTKDRHSWRYTKTVLIVMGVYFLCWIPVGIVLILYVDGKLSDKTVGEQGTVLIYASAFAYLNSIVNPIIYAFKISAVKARFYVIFCCRQRRDFRLDTSVGERTRVTHVAVSNVALQRTCMGKRSSKTSVTIT